MNLFLLDEVNERHVRDIVLSKHAANLPMKKKHMQLYALFVEQIWNYSINLQLFFQYSMQSLIVVLRGKFLILIRNCIVNFPKWRIRPPWRIYGKVRIFTHTDCIMAKLNWRLYRSFRDVFHFASWSESFVFSFILPFSRARFCRCCWRDNTRQFIQLTISYRLVILQRIYSM